MEEERIEQQEDTEANDPNMRTVIREVIQEFVSAEQSQAAPAYKTELVEERRRREQLERRVNELVKENERSQSMAEEAERNSAIRNELQRIGVTKVDLGFRAVKDDIIRAEDGRLVAKSDQGEVTVEEYLNRFVAENPELLPARIPGGSGAGAQGAAGLSEGGLELDQIKPGMDPKQLAKARREIAEAIAKSIRGA
ncbi:MAG: hypothetical protein GY953_09715 [bacterium]|nr:hypothetical protein [bacterium]